jgi:hypothetical protein
VAGDPDESAFGASEFQRTRELVHVGIAICDFPIGSEPSKQQGHVARDPGESEFGISGFPES